MSLPQTTTMKPTQSSIKSFFQPRQQPSYAPPPPSSKFAPAPGAAAAPPPPASKPPNTTTSTTTPPPTTTSPATAPPASTPLTLIPPSAPLHPQASIRPVADQDLQALRRINSLLLPVAYPETFYAAALTGPFSRVITWTDPATSATQVVGGVVARVEPSPFPPPASSTRPEHALYIQSLALLSPYRSHGLATAAIDHLIAAASSSPAFNLRYIYAHVWTDNEEGMHWYASRGFERCGDALQGYYIKLRPDSAYIVRRAVGPLSLGSSGGQQQPSAAPVSGPTAAVANLPPMNTSNGGPPPAASNGQSPMSATSDGLPGGSFQNRRAETEWNDLPADMAPSMLVPPRNNGGGSGASSRSSSSARKKKDRAYPAAAFSG